MPGNILRTIGQAIECVFVPKCLPGPVVLPVPSYLQPQCPTFQWHRFIQFLFQAVVPAVGLAGLDAVLA